MQGFQRASKPFGALMPLAALLVRAASARAEIPPALVVRGVESSCPSPRTVAQDIARLWPRVAVSVNAGEPRAVVVEITDRGSAYRVRVGGRSRELSDPSRQCNERAKAATVFVAFTLAPPSVDLPFTIRASLPAAPSSAAAAASMPATRPSIVIVAAPRVPASSPAAMPQPSRVSVAAPPRAGVPAQNRQAPISGQLDLGALADVADSGDGTGGATIGAAITGSLFGVALDAAYVAPVDLRTAMAEASLSRVPIDLSVRLHRATGRLDLAGDLGGELAVLAVRGEGVSTPLEGSRFEAGLAGAGRLQVALGRNLGAFLRIRFIYLPLPYRLVVEPGRVVGDTPGVWITASVGLSVRIF